MTIETKVSMKEKIKKLIAERLEKKLEEITDETTLEDLGADSLDRTEIVMSLEEKYGIDVKDEDYSNLRSFGQITDYFEREHAKYHGGGK